MKSKTYNRLEYAMLIFDILTALTFAAMFGVIILVWLAVFIEPPSIELPNDDLVLYSVDVLDAIQTTFIAIAVAVPLLGVYLTIAGMCQVQIDRAHADRDVRNLFYELHKGETSA